MGPAFLVAEPKVERQKEGACTFHRASLLPKLHATQRRGPLDLLLLAVFSQAGTLAALHWLRRHQKGPEI